MTTDSQPDSGSPQPLGLGCNEELGAGAEARCTYPACRCPFDAPATPGWCTKGFRSPFLFAGREHSAWYVWRQERAYDTMAQRVAGPFAAREEAEARLGPLLAQLEAPNVRAKPGAVGDSA